MPEEELGVAVDVGGQGLVQSDEVLISAARLGELAGRLVPLQALDSIDVRLAVRVGVRVPLAADARVAAGALPLLELLELLVQLAGGHGKDVVDDVGNDVVDDIRDEVGDDLVGGSVRNNKLRHLVLSILDVFLDGGDGSVDTGPGLVEGERTSELGSLELNGWESGREIIVVGERSALSGSRVLGKREGGSGDSQNGCGE